MHLSLNEIKKSYALLKQMVLQAFQSGDLELTLSAIDKAVVFVQQFNWIYTDNELEQLLNEISKQKLKSKDNYLALASRVVLYDDWCTSYILVLQYVEALSLNFEEVLYITSKDVSGVPNILDRISTFTNVKITVIPKNPNRFERSQKILDTIIHFHPSKLFLHIGYNSPITLALYSMPSGIVRYLINLADQIFWLGAQGIDYTLEFRPFGATVSLEKRGLKKEQLLYLPFYPVRDRNPFQGFPEQTKGKVVIFSGGDFYKTLDPKNTYWDLVRDVLNDNPEAVFLYATKNLIGNSKEFINSFISTNRFEERFIYIGFRPDIDEVFKHCDIFMGTCPVCGSLTSQLAAANSKPILQYYLPETYDDETEQALCHNEKLQISFNDKKAFMVEAKKLIQDKNYRIECGEMIHQAMFSKEQFNKIFLEVVKSNVSALPLKTIDYKTVTERWWWNEKMGFTNNIQFLFILFGKKKYLLKYPQVAIKYYVNRFF